MALGSNLGDRLGYLRTGVAALERTVSVTAVSSVYGSAPMGYVDQPDFFNAVLIGGTKLEPLSLLEECRRIEDAAGRERPFSGAPRTLDLDLVLYGDRVLETAAVQIPHPRFRERAFVLAPLDEVAAGWVDPATGRTVEEIWREIRSELAPVSREAPPEALWKTTP